jgi:Na+/H+ antiporter NhaC
MNKPKRASALLPILIFLIIYIGCGVYYEYINPQEGVKGFYVMSVVVAFVIALTVALLQNRSVKFDDKIRICAKGVGDDNILTMIFIFLLAGCFSGLASATGCAADTANLLLSIIPANFTVPGIFIISCIISMAMGTSCGTITVMGTLTLSIAQTAELSIPLCFGTLVGGAMFGDNLSFISDTTIAATKTQGCLMKDKFRANLKIALPAAIVALVILILVSLNGGTAEFERAPFNIVRALPYFLILIAALAGINVFIVLGIGVLLCAFVGLLTGSASVDVVLSSMGSGVSGMFETIIVTILVASLGALIKYNGGFEVILDFIKKHFKGQKGGQLGIAAISSIMDIATANNTVAIVVAAPIARDIRTEYGISPQKTASLLDIFTCVWQGIIPYGAQLLIASSIAGVSSMQIIPYLFYPFLLFISAILFICLEKDSKKVTQYS